MVQPLAIHVTHLRALCSNNTTLRRQIIIYATALAPRYTPTHTFVVNSCTSLCGCELRFVPKSIERLTKRVCRQCFVLRRGGCTKIQPPFLSAMHVCGFRLINLWPFIRRYTHTCAWLSRTGRLDGNPYIIRKPHVFWLKKKSFIARRVNWKGFFFYTQLKTHLHY